VARSFRGLLKIDIGTGSARRISSRRDAPSYQATRRKFAAAGYKPQVALEDGIARYIDWIRASPTFAITSAKRSKF